MNIPLRAGTQIRTIHENGMVIYRFDPPVEIEKTGMYTLEVVDGEPRLVGYEPIGKGILETHTQVFHQPLRLTSNRMHASDDRLRRFAELVYGEWNHEPTPLLDALSRSLPDRPPPSRYTRLRWQLRAAERRVQDAWRVLWHGLPEHDD